MKGSWFICCIVTAGLFLGAIPMSAQEDKSQPPGGADMDAMMREWHRWADPAAMHKQLDKMVGNWTATSKFWMDPAAEPMTAQGSATMSWILGGRWLRQEYRGEMMGMLHEGIGMTGYDNFKGRYVSTWVDNMTTAMIHTTGTYDSTGNAITLTGLIDEPMTGEREKKVHFVWKWTDPDTHVFEGYDNIPGKGEVKVMEITYARVKP